MAGRESVLTSKQKKEQAFGAAIAPVNASSVPILILQ